MLSDMEKSILRDLHTKLMKPSQRPMFTNPTEKIDILLFGSEKDKRELAHEYAVSETLPAIKKEVQMHNTRGQDLFKKQRDLTAYLDSK